MAVKLTDHILTNPSPVKYLKVNVTGDVTGSGTVDLTSTLSNFNTANLNLNVSGDLNVSGEAEQGRYFGMTSHYTTGAIITVYTGDNPLTTSNSNQIGEAITITNPIPYTIDALIMAFSRTRVLNNSDPSTILNYAKYSAIFVNGVVLSDNGKCAVVNENLTNIGVVTMRGNSSISLTARAAKNSASIIINQATQFVVFYQQHGL